MLIVEEACVVSSCCVSKCVYTCVIVGVRADCVSAWCSSGHRFDVLGLTVYPSEIVLYSLSWLHVLLLFAFRLGELLLLTVFWRCISTRLCRLCLVMLVIRGIDVDAEIIEAIVVVDVDKVIAGVVGWCRGSCGC
ncbi:hypothetical protein RND81_07G020600 [Saponaria officinalis]|uniref:Transmembrane protein n=1 Tax=Saponaria officinalis TaxID=3572 RepID=A0AAW1JPN0_SAPOF